MVKRDPVLIDLALQGGGSHGAFTWGVLDRLLEEPWLQIDGISGTSAGAMNAAVLADGHAKGGANGRALPWRASGATCLALLSSAPSGVGRYTCFWVVGHWTIPRFMSPWISCRVCSRPTN